MKKIIFILCFICFLFKAEEVSADSLVAESSAYFRSTIENEEDYREIKLQLYLQKMNSPLSAYSYFFIKEADENNLDWRLVPAIAGVESTFAKNMPKNSYNAYGWANGNYKFKSWENSIDIVSNTLRDKYLNKGALSIRQIARIYAPPSKTWANNVKFFINKIDPLPLEYTL
ncbi:hypothetical protein A2W13_00325 [Candidatus Woesebacteria bacterium RBG_16_36_11]|uniref:Mannosyl-glycoprotein endo-beta-N-acetylglucosamidase-like domain-containing protein n=3 Tax=Candidatus Woeseibacteriota TaxID=1752722 RepID=A0A1F7X729_9BACT|nr:MAG: hypothetical protein A2Z67_00740 [Candidatus Woesebacteria bacterium RBG_13_36_22]OGM10880.1 MAG: hypothetical protein A2W13_00325 [Candidatus Woesebacteria bacterium RBG_16_36_11]OGM16849.1 MAG: hypothetical protein A2V55_02720 [Candidatus Woesebacteria bacterium RBG_19FT_COMBO_37_29]